MNDSTSTAKRWYERIGPGLITACVVIGPGSILTSSTVGATYGFSLVWVVLLAVLFMVTYMAMGARLGVVSGRTPGELITQDGDQLLGKPFGRILASIIGIGIFFIASAFQFGNNLGVHSAFDTYLSEVFEESGTRLAAGMILIVLFNALALGFLFLFQNLYRIVERLMMVFVGLMLLAFLVNLGFARPDPLEMLKGVLPVAASDVKLDLSVLGLVGTTFVISAAFFQPYLVRQKGWDRAALRDGLIDARVGAIIMALITIMIMSTAAAVLRGASLENVADVARQLDPLFGGWGRHVFCVGLFSAAYSSFLVNSMVGGYILVDGLGYRLEGRQRPQRVATAGVLLIGMAVAMYVVWSGKKPVYAIVAAQAVTVIASPLMALALLWLANRSWIMHDERNGWWSNLIGLLGVLILLAMSYRTVVKLTTPAPQPTKSQEKAWNPRPASGPITPDRS